MRLLVEHGEIQRHAPNAHRPVVADFEVVFVASVVYDQIVMPGEKNLWLPPNAVGHRSAGGVHGLPTRIEMSGEQIAAIPIPPHGNEPPSVAGDASCQFNVSGVIGHADHGWRETLVGTDWRECDRRGGAGQDNRGGEGLRSHAITAYHPGWSAQAADSTAATVVFMNGGAEGHEKSSDE